jgi:NAD(P)-dependent dehydrogenase (short-subunit alcohol dehydrogenase family)
MKTVVITGTGRGVGFELASAFLDDPGWNVISLVRRPELHALVHARHKVIKCDLLEYESIKDSVLKISSFAAKVDCLVNNAGFLLNKPMHLQSDEEIIQTYRTNVIGPHHLIAAILPLFVQGSHIVNISSIGGITGTSKFPGLSSYSSSKGSLTILSELLAEEFSSMGISVNCIALGAVSTEMLATAFPGYQAKLSAFEVAGWIKSFCTDGGKVFNGKVLPLSITNP